jgi:HlyD family secretion protein
VEFPKLTKQRLVIAGASIALVGLLAFVFLRAGPLAATSVTVYAVKQGGFSPALFGVGTVEARRSWMIGPTVAGRVAQVHVDVGDTVKAGQLLAEMDSIDLDQKLSAQDASISRTVSTQMAAQAQQTDALARYELAKLNFSRNQDLAKLNFISPSALELRTQEKISAEAAYEVASANLSGVKQDVIRLKAERAGLQQQRNNVRLIAPADGVVTTRDAESGTTVVAGQPVIRLIDPQSLWVKLRLDQGRSAGLQAGLDAHIVVRSQAQNSFKGQVVRVELLSDSVTEERVALVSFAQLPKDVSVGEVAEVTLTLSPVENALLIPNASIQRQGGNMGVWRLIDGKPVFTKVRVGASSLDGDMVVLEGLQLNDQVVVHSQKALNENSRVSVVEALR